MSTRADARRIEVAAEQQRGCRRRADLTLAASVGINTNMRAALLLHERRVLAENRFAEIVIWQVPRPVRGSIHRFKYRLALVVDEVCVLRFDNEAGKGDHKHVGERQMPYAFTTPEQLIADFWHAVEDWRSS